MRTTSIVRASLVLVAGLVGIVACAGNTEDSSNGANAEDITASKAAPLQGRKCGTEEPTADKRAQINAEIEADRARKHTKDAGAGTGTGTTATIEVPVWFHVINKGTGIANGDVPHSQITDQVTVLNKSYSDAGMPFHFTLAGTDRTKNTTWYNVTPGTAAQTAMKKALRKGGPETLNIYLANLGGGLLGYSTFPSDYAGNPKDDGCVILFSSLPGGSSAPYNLGGTVTHEVGHWVGLYHTFQDGCTNPNDEVDDTPAQAEPTSGCPTTKPDTCTGSQWPGADLISNYMDYSDDICYTEFTPGQVKRATDAVTTYREGN